MLEQFRQTWEAMDRRQQISLAALALVVVSGLVAVGTWATRPS